MKIFYVVGHNKGKSPEGCVAWEFAGVFDDHGKALKACEEDHFFIGPTLLNRKFPLDTVEWPGCYYPHLQDRPTISVFELERSLRDLADECSQCVRVNTDCPKITLTGYCQFNPDN